MKLAKIAAFEEFELHNSHQIKGGYRYVVTNTDAGTTFPDGDHVEHTYSGDEFIRTDGYGGGHCYKAISDILEWQLLSFVGRSVVHYVDTWNYLIGSSRTPSL